MTIGIVVDIFFIIARRNDCLYYGDGKSNKLVLRADGLLLAKGLLIAFVLLKLSFRWYVGDELQSDVQGNIFFVDRVTRLFAGRSVSCEATNKIGRTRASMTVSMTCMFVVSLKVKGQPNLIYSQYILYTTSTIEITKKFE